LLLKGGECRPWDYGSTWERNALVSPLDAFALMAGGPVGRSVARWLVGWLARCTPAGSLNAMRSALRREESI